MSTAKPTIIFVPGAWHKPDVYEAVSSRLQSLGYKTIGVTLPSVGASPTLDDFQPDVAAIRDGILSAINAGSEVAVFSHSYGGFPASEAVKGLTKSDLEAQGKPGGVSQFILCTAFLLPEGYSAIDPEKGPSPQYELAEDGTIVRPLDPKTIFYNDLPEDTASRLVKALEWRQSYKPFWSKLTYAAWKHVPTTYLYTENDLALPLQFQKMMVEGSGVNIKTETFNAGHSVFVSQPEAVVDSIRRAIGEEILAPVLA